jgi:hypothetical protein
MEWLGEVKSMSSLEIYLYGLRTCKNFTHYRYIYETNNFLICIFTNLIAHNKNMHTQIWYVSTCIKKFILGLRNFKLLKQYVFQYTHPNTWPAVIRSYEALSMSTHIRIEPTMFKNMYLN